MYEVVAGAKTHANLSDLRGCRMLAKNLVGWTPGNKAEIRYEGKTIQTVEIVLRSNQPARRWTPSGQSTPLSRLLELSTK